MMIRKSDFILFVGLLVGCKPHRDAPPPASESQIVWSAIAGDLKPAPDSTYAVDVEVQADVMQGWHVYSLTQTKGGPTPLSVSIAPSPPYEIDGPITGPAPKVAWDSTFAMNSETYSGEAIFRIPVKMHLATTISVPPIEVRIRSQACSDRLCLPARTTTLMVTPRQRGT
jgi:hypothetical protein